MQYACMHLTISSCNGFDDIFSTSVIWALLFTHGSLALT